MSSERGATLIETLVAAALLALGASVIGQFLIHNIRFQGSNHRHTIAYSLAEQELEDLRSLEYGDIVSRTREEQVDNRGYTITTDVVDDQPGPNMKEIEVEVAWNEPGGERNVTVQTVYTAIKR